MSLLDLDEKLGAELTAELILESGYHQSKTWNNIYYKDVKIDTPNSTSLKTGIIAFNDKHNRCMYNHMDLCFPKFRFSPNETICGWNDGINTYEDLMKFEMEVRYKINQIYGR